MVVKWFLFIDYRVEMMDWLDICEKGFDSLVFFAHLSMCYKKYLYCFETSIEGGENYTPGIRK